MKWTPLGKSYEYSVQILWLAKYQSYANRRWFLFPALPPALLPLSSFLFPSLFLPFLPPPYYHLFILFSFKFWLMKDKLYPTVTCFTVSLKLFHKCRLKMTLLVVNTSIHRAHKFPSSAGQNEVHITVPNLYSIEKDNFACQFSKLWIFYILIIKYTLTLREVYTVGFPDSEQFGISPIPHPRIFLLTTDGKWKPQLIPVFYEVMVYLRLKAESTNPMLLKIGTRLYSNEYLKKNCNTEHNKKTTILQNAHCSIIYKICDTQETVTRCRTRKKGVSFSCNWFIVSYCQ